MRKNKPDRMTSRATRIERLHFLLAMDKQQAETHIADIHTILGNQDLPELQEDDTFKITYDVWLSYFGIVETKLAAINRLLDVPGLVRKVSLDDLQQGYSILVNIVRQIETLQHKMGDNHAL